MPSNPTPQKMNGTQFVTDNEMGGVIEGDLTQEHSDEGLMYIGNDHMLQLWDQIQQVWTACIGIYTHTCVCVIIRDLATDIFPFIS